MLMPADGSVEVLPSSKDALQKHLRRRIKGRSVIHDQGRATKEGRNEDVPECPRYLRESASFSTLQV